MYVVVTAFNAFANLKTNSSEVAVRQLGRTYKDTMGSGLRTVVLPTAYRLVDENIRALLQPPVPDVLLMSGMSAGAREVRVESVARNYDACAARDNVGDVRRGDRIRVDGPEVYRSTIDPWAVWRALTTLGIPVVVSDDAGGFVCNHASYIAHDEIAQRRLATRCGFLHLPGLDARLSRRKELSARRSWSAQDLSLVLRMCLDMLGQRGL